MPRLLHLWGKLGHSELWKGEEGVGLLLSVIVSVCPRAHLWLLIQKRGHFWNVMRMFHNIFPFCILTSFHCLKFCLYFSPQLFAQFITASCMQASDMYRSESFTLWNILCFSHTSSFLDWYICDFYSLEITDHAQYPDKTTGKIIVLCILRSIVLVYTRHELYMCTCPAAYCGSVSTLCLPAVVTNPGLCVCLQWILVRCVWRSG